MRSLRRNKRTIRISNVVPNEFTYDEFGNKLPVYAPPFVYKIVIADSKSNSQYQPYGKDISYDKELITHDMNCPINKKTKIWINDIEYTISGINDGLDIRSYAIKSISKQ